MNSPYVMVPWQVYTNTVARELNAALGADNNNFGFVSELHAVSCPTTTSTSMLLVTLRWRLLLSCVLRAAILVFDLSTSAAQRLMSAAATAKAFGKAGVEKSKCVRSHPLPLPLPMPLEH